MEPLESTLGQNEPVSQRFYALEQLSELSNTISLAADIMQTHRDQLAERMISKKKEEAFEIYRLLENQRDYLASQIRAARPLLMELESPLADSAKLLAEQLSALPLMMNDYAKVTKILKRFASSLPSCQTVDVSTIGRLMNNVRLGHYPTDLSHVGYIARSIAFPDNVTVNLLDPCCGTGDALLRLALNKDSRCYGIELDDCRAQRAQQQLYRVGFGTFFGATISTGSFHVVFLNPPYLSVLSKNGGRSRDEKRFLIESIPLLMIGGFLAYIIPYYRLTEDLCRIICDNFEQVRIHRFLDSEFRRFKQVAVTGIRCRRKESPAEAIKLLEAAEQPDVLSTLDHIPSDCYELPSIPRNVETFRGTVFNEEELARQLEKSTGFDRLFAKNRLDSEIKRPPLPLSIGQVGLVGGSGLLNGLMECEYPHIIKGRIIKEKHVITDEKRSVGGCVISTEIRETISNRMIFNILTPSGFRSLT